MLCFFSVSLSLAAAPDAEDGLHISGVLSGQDGGIDRDCCNIEKFPTPQAACHCKGKVCEDEAAEDGAHYCPRGSNETAAQCCAHKTEVCAPEFRIALLSQPCHAELRTAHPRCASTTSPRALSGAGTAGMRLAATTTTPTPPACENMSANASNVVPQQVITGPWLLRVHK